MGPCLKIEILEENFVLLGKLPEKLFRDSDVGTVVIWDLGVDEKQQAVLRLCEAMLV